jgi:RNA polymerase sigma-70 factor (ECF subfamily)
MPSIPSNDRSVVTRLLRRARDGDPSSLGKLLELHRTYLTLLARDQIGPRLQGKAGLSDIVQETFLEAHRDFGGFRGATPAELAEWLRRILAHNLANHVARYFGTKRRDIRLERELVEALDASSCQLDERLAAWRGSPSGQAMQREQTLLLSEALGQLPEHYRQVLVLRHIDDLPFPEVAKKMGRSENSVKNLWARALARLRGVMEEGGRGKGEG